MLTLDAPAAIQAMPRLLEGETPAAIRTALDEMKRVLEAAEPLSAAARESLDEMEHIFEAAARRPSITAATAPPRHGRGRARPPRRRQRQGRRGRSAIEPAGAAAKQAARRTRRDGASRRNRREGIHEGRNQNRIEDHNPNRRQIGRPRKPANNKTKPQ